ncbi:MAG: radical SAM protein, partial [bacterium]|nr:radical SAM protein [bacterium]
MNIGFYGGEPLLAYKQVKRAVERIHELNEAGRKDIQFNLTTNGTLLTEEMLEFFERHGFAMMLSFDGLVQDAGRKEGTIDKTIAAMQMIQAYPGIDFEINSVFSPRTIGRFADSIRYMIELGSPDITFTIASTATWNFGDLITLRSEMERLTGYLAEYYEESGLMPVKN